VQEAIVDVINGDVDIRDSSQADHFNCIKRHAPMLADAIVKNMDYDKLNPYVAELIKYILVSIMDLFANTAIPTEEHYGAPCNSPYDFFPRFPPILGKAHYVADKNINLDSYCRKHSSSHPTLSPGIFTVFCRHGICFGFSLMTVSESPRTPFNIFLSRFSNHLSQLRIFYDNCCNLHVFSLNREPARFSETTFLVDRLHYQDHSSCTAGYSTSAYNSDPSIKTVNTQVNEQANADLRNLGKQIAHMTPDNVMLTTKLFLADRNRRKKVMLQ
jgi:hypothetical protein